MRCLSIALLVVTATAAQADTCVFESKVGLIAGGDALSTGVPNYAQADFTGGNDCGPTAANMLLGYYDANGWACLMPGTGAYYSGGQPPAGVVSTDGLLKDALPYGPIFGTPPIEGQDLIGDAVVEVVAARGAGAWTFEENGELDYARIANDIDAGRPFMLALLGNSGEFVNDNGIIEDVGWHWVTAVGYRFEVMGDQDGLDCDVNGDVEAFIEVRMGWFSGGTSQWTYNVAFWDDTYTVHFAPEPGSECTDQVDADGDGAYVTVDSDGVILGGECDDENHWVYPGANELCNGIDDDCDGTSDEGFGDADLDGLGDMCDDDDDQDGHNDDADNCPKTPNPEQHDIDQDGMGDACDDCVGPNIDTDEDGICDAEDLCPGVVTTNNYDGNGDGIGKGCDWDEDGVLDAADNCDNHQNPNQADLDGDGKGDACDGDVDGDGITYSDNCPTTANSDQSDLDGDGLGDACDCLVVFGIVDSTCMTAMISDEPTPGGPDTGPGLPGGGVPQGPPPTLPL